MAKIFTTSGTGAQQTLNETDNNKLKVYDSYEDIDTTELIDGEVVSTKETSADGSNIYDYINEHIGEAQSYSIEEQLTGAKWVDGKPIYRVVLYQDVANINSSFLFPTTIANVDRILDMRLCIKSSNNVTQYAGEVYCYTPRANVDFDGTTKIQATRQESAVLNGRQYCVVEYTKTTD